MNPTGVILILVWNCRENLNILGEQTAITLAKKIMTLPEQRTKMLFFGPEPMFGNSRSSARNSIISWVKEKRLQDFRTMLTPPNNVCS